MERKQGPGRLGEEHKDATSRGTQTMERSSSESVQANKRRRGWSATNDSVGGSTGSSSCQKTEVRLNCYSEVKAMQLPEVPRTCCPANFVYLLALFQSLSITLHGHIWTQLQLLLATWMPARYSRQKIVSPSIKSPILVRTQHPPSQKHLLKTKEGPPFPTALRLSVPLPTQHLKECLLTSAQGGPTLLVVLDL